MTRLLFRKSEGIHPKLPELIREVSKVKVAGFKINTQKTALLYLITNIALVTETKNNTIYMRYECPFSQFIILIVLCLGTHELHSS